MKTLTIEQMVERLQRYEPRTWRDYIPYFALLFFVVAVDVGAFLLGARR